ncbi:VWA domain-containing protein [Gemmata sp. JC717]|uniref:VWA domain-containing protein n=1 Tax=Gemmata algarum TaxID=2975278 RepID=UPI0021BABBC9|nr:vWA domain-containing protein [Gemmata algarum]MDY3554867.1 VWA domain-containing protein [Gemmata algarum]
MNLLKRLRVLPVLLGVGATLAALGTTLFGDMRTAPPGAPPTDPVRPDGGRFVEDLVATKFSNTPVLTYQPRDGELIFAWQVQPALAPQAARPRDVLVVVDTTASQAGRPLQQARNIITGLAAGLTAEDRVSVWSLSTPNATRTLTRDFQPATSENLAEAARALTEVEYGSGAADLAGGLDKALATMAPNRSRHQVVLYLGDGESAFRPVSEGDRIALGNRMDRGDVYFFAVPLGLKLEPQNLHGLAALTGGAVVRVQEDVATPPGRKAFADRLKAALDVPVAKPEKWTFGEEVGELYPTKLPPLRADQGTLVMGRLAKPAATAVSVAVSAAVNGRPVELKLSQPLPAPAVDNFFMNRMVDQWKSAPHKDAPAMLRSDRALALASTQVKLYRDEFLTQAVWAISADRFDEAEKLYAAAAKVDPTDKEAAKGAALAAQMKAGKVSKAALAEEVSKKVNAQKISPNEAIRTVLQDPKVNEPVPPANPGAAVDLLKEAAARRRIEEERYRVLADATVRRARQLLRTDPEGAYQDLKRQRDDILAYDGIGDDARRQLVADLEAVMREVFVKGAEIKRQADADRQSVARTKQRLSEFDRLADEQARDKDRIDQFRQLMKEARYDIAYQEAQLMVQEKVSRGLTVPVAASASYIIGQQATQLREWRELTRIREDRFLLAMMQTEKSHVPYPDEPPVHFPPATVWRQLTGLRREAYMNSNLGPNASESQRRLKSAIEDTEVDLENKNLVETPLFELLGFLAKKYNVSFVVMEEYFKADGVPNIREEKPKLAATQLRGLKLGNFLDLVLVSMNATFIVRPDYIEITTFQRKLEEKVTRVFPVADLAIPIPSSVNLQTLQLNQNVQNQTLAIFGAASGAANFLGGQFGAQGGINGLGNNNNPLNAGGNPGPFGNQGGNLGQNPNGVGGGFTGVGGGQLGQFGNLGGQFGIQGGDQSRLLMSLIFETVAKGEWAQMQGVSPQPGEGEDAPLLTAAQLNSLGYYPPARALIIRGTSRYHSAASVKLRKQDGMVGLPAKPAGGAFAIGPGNGNMGLPGNGNMGAGVALGAEKPGLVNPKVDAVAMRKALGADPRTMWSKAIDQTVTDPGLIVACAEFLMEFNEYGHAAEVLKGNLRKGLATEAWAHEALAVALQAGNGNPVEVERAAVSAIDLDPADAKAYLKAARAEDGLKNHAQAVAFCKRAAECSPNDPTPYANAMAYAERASDVRSDAVLWAANNLLKRDWSTTDGVDYHKQVNDRLPKLAAKLHAAGQKTDALDKVAAEQTRRDLVIELQWQGSADLDLVVTEPTGSVCSPTHKRTTAGGVLKADLLDQQNDRSEVYTAASAFSGVYTVTAKQAFGRPIGGRAQVKVTRFKGTPQESTDLLDVPLTGKPVEVKLVGGSRTELATVHDEMSAGADLRAETTGSAVTGGASGIGVGFGRAGAALNSPITSSNGPTMPVVATETEARKPGIDGAGDVRATYKLNPDRKTYSLTVSPVFAGVKGELALPKVPLLPGAEK